MNTSRPAFFAPSRRVPAPRLAPKPRLGGWSLTDSLLVRPHNLLFIPYQKGLSRPYFTYKVSAGFGAGRGFFLPI